MTANPLAVIFALAFGVVAICSLVQSVMSVALEWRLRATGGAARLGASAPRLSLFGAYERSYWRDWVWSRAHRSLSDPVASVLVYASRGLYLIIWAVFALFALACVVWVLFHHRSR